MIRTPPHNIDMEQALLACCMLDDGGRECRDRLIEQCAKPEWFYKPAHQLIFQCIIDPHKKGIAIDELVLGDELESKGHLDEIGGHSYLIEFTGRIDTASHFPAYLDRVKEDFALRELIRISNRTIESAYNGSEAINVLADAQSQINAVAESSEVGRVRSSMDVTKAVVDQVNELLQRGGGYSGVPSGFDGLDKLTWGFQPSDFIVVAARPSVGKTAFATSMISDWITSSNETPKTLFFSLEMPCEKVNLRIALAMMEINFRKVQESTLTPQAQHRLAQAFNQIQKAPVWWEDEPSITIDQMRSKALRIQKQHGLDIVIIDYLQLITPANTKAGIEERTSDISKGIKLMKKELGIPVIVLAQLNRETEKEKRRPRMSDLRGSGAVEQDADVIIMLHRDKDVERGAEEPRELIVEKQRNGPIGAINLNFKAWCGRYIERKIV